MEIDGLCDFNMRRNEGRKGALSTHVEGSCKYHPYSRKCGMTKLAGVKKLNVMGTKALDD